MSDKYVEITLQATVHSVGGHNFLRKDVAIESITDQGQPDYIRGSISVSNDIAKQLAGMLYEPIEIIIRRKV